MIRLELIFFVCETQGHFFCSINQYLQDYLLGKKKTTTFLSLLCSITFEKSNYLICVDIFQSFYFDPFVYFLSLCQ